MARFDIPDEDGVIIGSGEAAGGEIRAVVSAEGRLQKLRISPDLLRRTPSGGTFMDTATLAAEITRAVNAAFDDLARQAVSAAVPGDIAAQLDQVSADFTRSINDVRAELERTERRLDNR